jgi:DNA repair exonuclease SbcCD ATPase subunit
MATKVGEISITNFKKIKSLDVRANGGNVFIMGKNGTGKTTLIQALYCILTGKELPPDPITIGEQKGKISVKLMNDSNNQIECIAELTFTEKNPKGKLSVTTEDGRDVPGGPRTFLEKLTENLLFDPFDFIRKTPKEQVKEFKRMFGFNFDQLDAEHKDIWDKRAEINKDIKNLKGTIETSDIKQHEISIFKEKKDLSVIQAQMKDAEEKNKQYREAQNTIEKAYENLTKYNSAVEKLKEENAAIKDILQAYENIESYIRIVDEKAKVIGIQSANCMRLIDSIAMGRSAYDELKKDLETNENRITAGKAELTAEEAKITANKELLQTLREVSVEEMNKTFQEAVNFNQKVDKVQEFQQRLLQLDEKEQLSKEYSARLKEINEEKIRIISEKNIRVPGLTFDPENECLMYEGLAFDETQMSKSKIIAVGIELMMATNPNLKICRIKDGSLLDEQTLNELIAVINEQDFQAFVEIVSGEKEGLQVTVQEV